MDTFDTQIGNAYNVTTAIAEQWRVIKKAVEDINNVVKKTAVKDYNGNIFNNLTLSGANGVNVDISENDPEQLNISLDYDITNDLARSLKTPEVAPSEINIVSVNTNNSQEMIKLSGSDFYIENGVIKLRKTFIDLYPIGSIYLSLIDTSPENFIGGQWEKLPENYALWTATTNAGETISAGLPNITGYMNNAVSDQASGSAGAFTTTVGGYGFIGGQEVKWLSVDFDASKSNPIYGSSNTVQPPAIKVYVWKRIL